MFLSESACFRHPETCHILNILSSSPGRWAEGHSTVTLHQHCARPGGFRSSGSVLPGPLPPFYKISFSLIVPLYLQGWLRSSAAPVAALKPAAHPAPPKVTQPHPFPLRTEVRHMRQGTKWAAQYCGMRELSPHPSCSNGRRCSETWAPHGIGKFGLVPQ